MKLSSLCSVIFFRQWVLGSPTDATYNSFIRQIGYCRMQSYATVSRSTSDSVPMFMDGRVQFGVGLSNENMIQSGANLCGMCLNVTNVDNFYEWNNELTEWSEEYARPPDQPFLAMVFDRCPDPVCVVDFLDFDIYHPHQPVSRGNPRNVVWNFIPCPIYEHETIEYLLCTAYSCNEKDPTETSLSSLLEKNHYYWSLTIRNTRIPIREVVVYHPSDGNEVALNNENAWTYQGSLYDLKKGLNISFLDIDGRQFHDFIDVGKGSIRPHYHGGIFLSSKLQN